MAGVLVLLCVFFAVATLREQHPTGAAATASLAAPLQRLNLPPGASVLVVARDSEEDRAFASSAQALLQQTLRVEVVSAVGDPREARRALEAMASSGKSLAAIVTTPECANWPVLADLSNRFPALGQPQFVTPPSIRWPVFLTRQNLLNVANQIVVVAILSAGLTFVIVSGGIDLSVGSLIALAAVLATRLVRDQFHGVEATAGSLVVCSLAGIGAAALIGLFSGAVVVAFRVPAFIATLAVMQVASGLAFILAQGQSIYDLPESSTWLGRGVGFLGLPHAVALMALVYVGSHVLLSRTVLGRHLYAVGSNEASARLCGVPVGRVKLFAYTASGALAGLGGIVLASQLKSGAPTYGVSYELYAIAAVVVGGASLNGGEGRAFGTLIGAFIIAVINNGMNLTNVESYTQKVVLGLVILAAVLLDLLKKHLGRRTS